MMKTCKKCNKEKNEIYFHKFKGSKDGLSIWCKACKKEYDKKYRLEYNNRPEVIEYFNSEEYRIKKEKEYIRNLDRNLFLHARNRAYNKNEKFEITINDIDIPKRCPILDIPIYYIKGQGLNWNSPSVDRLDSSKGYVKGNVWIISRLANTMKSIANTEQLKTFSTNILKLIEDGTYFG